MDAFGRDDLRMLVEERGPWCISMYMPAHRGGPEVRQDPIRLKNLLRQAEEKLLQMGARPTEAAELLAPATKLIGEAPFWQEQQDGLAAFLSPRFFRTYRLHLSFDELLMVNERFHIKPLLPLVMENGRFYVLALSQNETRLLQGTRLTVREVHVKDLPSSLQEALRFDAPERQFQFHTRVPRGDGMRAPIYHGQGVGVDDAKQRVLRYFHQVDKAVCKFLDGERAPLVLAGVDYLFPIYEEANTYPQLVGEGIKGNPDTRKAEELHKKAWKIVRRFLRESVEIEKERYGQLSAAGRTSTDIGQVVPAAFRGRVAVLFVAVGQRQWGSFNPEDGSVAFHPEPAPGDEDLLDFAAVHTLVHHGIVHGVKPQEVPDQGMLAAILRF